MMRMKINPCDKLFYWSFFLSMVSLLSLYTLRAPFPIHLSFPYQSLVHGFSIVLLIYLISYLKIPKSAKIKGILMLLAVLAIFTIFEDKFGAVTFGYPIPPEAQEDVIETFVRNLGLSDPLGACPSGFALRQGIVTLSAYFILDQDTCPLKNDLKSVAKTFFLVILLYVSFGRFAGHSHQPVDVAVGHSLATLFFWAGVYFYLGRGMERVRQCWPIFMLLASGLFFLFTDISKTAYFWIWPLLAVLFLLPGVKLMKAEKIKSYYKVENPMQLWLSISAILFLVGILNFFFGNIFFGVTCLCIVPESMVPVILYARKRAK